MRIESPFKDYYDGLQAHQGYDKDDVVYRRVTKTYSTLSYASEDKKLPKELKFLNSLNNRLNIFGHHILSREMRVKGAGPICFKKVSVWFCGVQYFGYKVLLFESNPMYYSEGKTKEYIWSLDGLRRVLKTHNPYYVQPRGDRLSPLEAIDKFSSEAIREFRPSDLDKDLAFHHRMPCVIFPGSDYVIGANSLADILVDGKLSDIQFAKAVYPVQAFQELSMFFGNLIPEQRPMVQVEDKYKVIAHGFDKQSFRTRPKE